MFLTLQFQFKRKSSAQVSKATQIVSPHRFKDMPSDFDGIKAFVRGFTESQVRYLDFREKVATKLSPNALMAFLDSTMHQASRHAQESLPRQVRNSMEDETTCYDFDAFRMVAELQKRRFSTRELSKLLEIKYIDFNETEEENGEKVIACSFYKITNLQTVTFRKTDSTFKVLDKFRDLPKTADVEYTMITLVIKDPSLIKDETFTSSKVEG